MSEDLNNINVGLTDNGLVALVFHKKTDNLIMPWEKVDELARALTVMARKAEEIDKANRIIADNALLQRSGLLPGVGLSNHPKIVAETIKEALYNRVLRRAMPWRSPRVVGAVESIKSRGVVGAPTLTKIAANGSAK